MMRMGSSSTAIDNAIKKLIDLNINLLAVDFDQTFIDIHTGGRWPGTVSELLPHVRPEFQQLVYAVLNHNTKNNDTADNDTNHQTIHVAIVTFSSQPTLIKGVLEQCFGIDTANKIPIRGGDRSWTYTGSGSRDGKQAHIASSVEEILSSALSSDEKSSSMMEITKQTTLLIDDDRKNIRFALQDGTRAIWFNPDKPYLLLQDIAKLV